VCPARTPATRWAAGVYTAAAMLLFGISGLYHRFYWGPIAEGLLRRLDHANIFLLIAGTYTPFGIVLLHGADRIVLLATVWGGALIGVLFRVFWVGAPRWLYTPIYLAVGWVAGFWRRDFYDLGGAAVIALVYALKKPTPSPRWFGFHEIFHACTVAAFVVHYVAISLVTYTLAT